MRPPIAPALVRRSALALAGAAAAVALAAPAPASAAESAMPTAQAKAYGMDWVPYIDPADLPPVEQRKVICLVDSGVEVNPDLPADRAEGPIVMRTSVDNTSGLPGDKPEHAHGTSMASMAGALAGNDWGTVGAWPGVRIISMRALSYDRTTFAAGDWRRGVAECRSRAATWPIAAINLSLGSSRSMDDSERGLLEEQVLRAHNQQISVIAAAGNSGGPLETPANVAGVLPIAAGNTTDGSLCGYASWELGALIGPGCDISIAWQGLPARTDSGGSSSASAFASTLVALLRTLRPEASVEDAEGWLRRGASSAQGRPVLNGEIAARTAGLGAVVDRAQVRMAAATSSPGDSSVGDANPLDAINAVANPILPNSSNVVPGAAGPERRSAQLPRRLPTPRARARWSAGILTVVLQTHSRYSETLRVDIRSRDAATMIKRVSEEVARTGARFRLRARPDRVSVQLLPVIGDVIKASKRRTLRARRGGQFK